MPHVNVAGVVAVLEVEEEHRGPHNGGADGGSKEGAWGQAGGPDEGVAEGYDCDQETLNADETARWLRVRKQEAAAERRDAPGCRGDTEEKG